MEKLFISLFLAIFALIGQSSSQSVDDVCRLRISGTFPHPDPQRCDLFIQCLFFRAIVRECSDGTIFPPSGGSQCVPGDRDTCTVDGPSPTPPPPITTTTTVSPNVCDGVPTGQVLEIPNDCTRFIVCIFGVPNIVNCNSNEVFHPPQSQCVPGNPITCEVFGITTTTTTPTTTTTTTTTVLPPITTTTPSITTTTTTRRTTAPPTGNVCSGNNFRYVADPSACYKYFLCLYGVPLPRECSIGRIFIERLQTCVPGNRSTCQPFIIRLSENVQLLNFSNRF